MPSFKTLVKPWCSPEFSWHWETDGELNNRASPKLTTKHKRIETFLCWPETCGNHPKNTSVILFYICSDHWEKFVFQLTPRNYKIDQWRFQNLSGQRSLNFSNRGNKQNKQINKSKTTTTPDKIITNSQRSVLEKCNLAVNAKTVVKLKKLPFSCHILSFLQNKPH